MNFNPHTDRNKNPNLNQVENSNPNLIINPSLIQNLDISQNLNLDINEKDNSERAINIIKENIVKEKEIKNNNENLNENLNENGNEIKSQIENQKLEKEKIEKNYKEELKILFDKKILTTWELFKYSYFSFCFNEKLKKKYEKFDLAIKRICKGTDFLEMIKLNKEFKILKYLTLNNIQQKSMDFINNLPLNKEGFFSEDDNFPEVLDTGYDNFDCIKILSKYFKTKSDSGDLSAYDKKILKIIHPDIKEMLCNLKD